LNRAWNPGQICIVTISQAETAVAAASLFSHNDRSI
jgi:hypothetical protein